MSVLDVQCCNIIAKSERHLADDTGLKFPMDLDTVHRPEFVAEALEFPSSPYHMNQFSPIRIDEKPSNSEPEQALISNSFMEPLRQVSGGKKAPPKRFFRTFWRALTWKLLEKNNGLICRREKNAN